MLNQYKPKCRNDARIGTLGAQDPALTPKLGKRYQAAITGPVFHRLGLFIKGFGRDSAGEIYLLASPHLGPYGTGGVVLKIVDLCTQRLAGDIDKNCLVNFGDFVLLAADWLRDVQR